MSNNTTNTINPHLTEGDSLIRLILNADTTQVLENLRVQAVRNTTLPAVYVVTEIDVVDGIVDYAVSNAYPTREAAQEYLTLLVHNIIEDDTCEGEEPYISEWKIDDQLPEFWKAVQDEMNKIEVCLHECSIKQ